MRTKAPWTDEQVAKLNEFQRYAPMHPFTCGNDCNDEMHVAFANEHDEENGQLIATNDGWICPVCNYTQNWAHDFMLDGAPEWLTKTVAGLKAEAAKAEAANEKKETH